MSEAALSAGDAFHLLEWEAGQNGNTNWVFFPESAEHFRGLAKIVLDAIEPHSVPESWGDDADEARYLLFLMLEESPRDLPCSAEEYAPLGRELERLGLLEDSKTQIKRFGRDGN